MARPGSWCSCWSDAPARRQVPGPGDNRRESANYPEDPIAWSAAPGADPGNPFAAGTARWIGVLGRLRDVVRQEVLRSQLAGLPQLDRPPARVLDVGCGQGTQALHLARAGHAVTGIDASAELLAAFGHALAGEPAAVAARVRLIRGAGE